MPREHDFTRAKWGHHVGVLRSLDGGRELRVTGWGSPVPERGDLLLLPEADTGIGIAARYRVRDVRPAVTPADQWFATLDLATARLERAGLDAAGGEARTVGEGAASLRR